MELGEKVRTLRKQAKWSLRELAQKSGVAVGTLSHIETGKFGGQITTHQKIAQSFGIGLPELYREVKSLEEETAPLTPTSEDVETFAYDENAHAILLARHVLDKTMLPQLIVLQPGGKTHLETNKPGCEKFLCVMEGTVEAQVGERRSRLERYGTLYFKASVPHRLSNPDTVVAKVLSVTSPVGL